MMEFIRVIYKWYNQNKRNLPWRETKDPYRIWISEIILQQTRVDQGWSYYNRFIEKFPDVETLASAREEEVLKLWQGLGYYSRARNLHKSAKTISTAYKGKFPDTYSGILALKGIGPYTAAAIASIAFKQPHPVLDGNVYRFLSRYFGISEPIDSSAGKQTFFKIAHDLIMHSNPGFHNEALMEFGALQCTPLSPDCVNCPLTSSCFAHANKMTGQLPVKEKKNGRRFRYFCYYLVDNGDSIWIEKRTGADIWKNLYQFPLIEMSKELTDEEALNYQPPFLRNHSFTIKSVSATRKHVLSHQTLFARLISIEVSNKTIQLEKYLKIQKQDLSNYPVPRLIEHLAQKSEILKF